MRAASAIQPATAQLLAPRNEAMSTLPVCVLIAAMPHCSAFLPRLNRLVRRVSEVKMTRWPKGSGGAHGLAPQALAWSRDRGCGREFDESS